jgi:integral membrane protein
VGSALIRYRVTAYVVGVALVLLVVVGVPLKYLADQPQLVATVGPVHGFLYMVYLVVTFDIGRRSSWSLTRMGLVMLAGTIPFASFYTERLVTRWSHETRPAQSAPTAG